MKKTFSHLILLFTILSFQQTALASLPFFSDDTPTLAPLVEKVSPAVVNISVSGIRVLNHLVMTYLNFLISNVLIYQNKNLQV